MKTISILLFLLILMLCSCDPSISAHDDGLLSIVTFNCQTLFDDIEDGDEFSPYSRYEGWSRVKYEKRIDKLREAVKNDFDADIIFFQEIESEKVLEDLLDTSLRRRGYLYYTIADTNNPITVGFISKYNPVSVSVHGSGGARLVMRSEFAIDGHQLIIYTLHAKSNSGDGEENREERKNTASLINSLVRHEMTAEVIILGDFNSEPGIYPDDMLTMLDPCSSREIIEESSIPVCYKPDRLDLMNFYDPLLDPSIPLSGNGTYYYNGSFFDYDRILLNKSLYDKSSAFSIDILTSSGMNGIPYRYDPGSGEGFSDHFPVKLTLCL